MIAAIAVKIDTSTSITDGAPRAFLRFFETLLTEGDEGSAAATGAALGFEPPLFDLLDGLVLADGDEPMAI